MDTVASDAAGPFTLFVPYDDYFRPTPDDDAAWVSELWNDETGLRAFVDAHVVDGHIGLEDFDGAQQSINQNPLNLETDGERRKVNNAEIEQPGVMADNGVAYFIPNDLEPSSSATNCTPATAATDCGEGEVCSPDNICIALNSETGTLWDYIDANPDFSIIKDLILSVGLDALFADRGIYFLSPTALTPEECDLLPPNEPQCGVTLLVPSNVAFEGLDLDEIREDVELEYRILNHLLRPLYTAEQLAQSGTLLSSLRRTFDFSADVTGFTVNGAQAREIDIATLNGTIHTIDQFLELADLLNACDAPESLSLDTTVTGRTEGVFSSQNSVCGGNGLDTAFAWTGVNDEPVCLRAESAQLEGEPAYYPQLHVRRGSCGVPEAEIVCDTNFSGNPAYPDAQVQMEAIAGETYYIFVDELTRPDEVTEENPDPKRKFSLNFSQGPCDGTVPNDSIWDLIVGEAQYSVFVGLATGTSVQTRLSAGNKRRYSFRP